MESAELALELDPKLGAAQAIRALITIVADDETQPGALALARDAVARDPRSVHAWCALALCLPDDGDIASAAARAIELDERSPYALIALGRACIVRGDVGASIAAAARAIEASPRFSPAYRSRGQLRARSGDPGWRGDLEKALELAPRDAYTCLYCASNFFVKGEHARALELLDRAIELDARRPNVHAQRAAMLIELGRYGEAVPSASRAIRMASDRAWFWSLRALARAALGEHEGAASDATMVLSLPHDAADEAIARRARGLALASWGDMRAAFDDMTKGSRVENGGAQVDAARAWLASHPRAKEALPVDREEATRIYNRAHALMTAERFDEAEPLLTLVVHTAPVFAEGWSARGACRANLKRVAEGIADLTQSLDLDPEGAIALAIRCRLYLRQDDTSRALADAEACVRRHPRHADAWIVRSELRRRSGSDIPGAIADAATAITVAPWSTDAHLRLGMALEVARDEAGARAAFERVAAFEAIAPRIDAATREIVRRWLELHPRR